MLIKMENVKYRYKRNLQVTSAIDGINVKIDKGEFISIIGRNGSGKSTFAKLLNAILIPTEGDVYIKGVKTTDENHLWEIRKSVGMVFQNPDNQIVATTVEEDVAFGPENLGIPSVEIRRRVDEALKLVGIYDYRQHAPHLLSGGQKQRVAIAGVLAMQPRCLVLDEPTAMLDPRGRREVMDTVRRLNREEGITVIFITHFMEEAVYADRVIVLGDGEIIFQGTPEETFRQSSLLRNHGLDVPPVAELAEELRAAGLAVPDSMLTVEEMVEQLCR